MLSPFQEGEGRTDSPPVVTHNEQEKVFLRMCCKMMDLPDVWGESCADFIPSLSGGEVLPALQALGGPHGHNGANTKLRQSGLGPRMDEQGGEGRGPGGGQVWDK